MDSDQIKDRLVEVLENDTSDLYFNSLNEGEIISRFKTRENYIYYIKNNSYFDYNLIGHLLSIPKVISKNGINIIIFKSKKNIIKKQLQKDLYRTDFVITCSKTVTKESLKNKYGYIFIINENKNYFPIIYVKKKK